MTKPDPTRDGPSVPGGPSAAAEGAGAEPEPALPLRRRPARRVRRRRGALLGGAVALALVLGGSVTTWALVNRGDAVDPRDRETPSADSAPLRASPSAPPALVPEPAPTASPEPPPPAPAPAPAPRGSLDDPNSLQVVVNKRRPLAPAGWAPSDLVLPAGIPNTNGQPLRAEAAAALERMHAASSAAGLPLTITSAYRSFALQTSLFESYSARDGVAAAETYSARPGHSEHQTGLAADLDDGSGCAFMDCFGETPTGLWLRANAPAYGFILRYDRGQEPVVGYIFEPWHFRYIGTEISLDMQRRGVVNLEEYLGLPAAPSY